jgi:hypothetical protein
MDAEELIAGLRKSSCSDLEVERRTTNRFMIHTGYTYPDGDELHILLVDNDGKWILTDEGHTTMWLSYENFKITDSRRNLLDRTLNTNGVTLSDGELYIEVNPNSAGLGLRSIIQAEIQIADLLYLSKENVKDTFMEDLKSAFIDSRISDKCTYNRKIVGQDGMEYRADVCIDGSTPILIFGIRTPMQCARATIAMLSLNKDGPRYLFMAVFDNNPQIPDGDRDKAINAAVKTTVGIDEAVRGAEMLMSLQSPESIR